MTAAMTATLDRDDPPGPGAALPPLWHSAHFRPLARWSDLAPYGHTKRGGFIPPVSRSR
jgi:3-methylfumaryl-CoA hydratase